MKTKDIAKKYGLVQYEFEAYLRLHKTDDIQIGFMGISVEKDIEGYVERFKKYSADKKAEEEFEKLAAALKAKEERILAAEKRKAEEEKQKALANMLITSGFNFDGYRITRYSGYISGDDAISINRGTDGLFSSPTNVSKSLTDSLVKIRRQAIKELKEAAYDLGCNAVIGVDFDYITIDPETANSSGGTTYLPYVFCVTANGNAVVIEKVE